MSVWAVLALLGAVAVFVPVAIAAPALTIGVGFGAAVLIWLAQQGRFRFALGLLVMMMLGATSSVEAWAAIATYGRVFAVVLVLALVFMETRSLDAHGTRSQRGISTMLLALAFVALSTTLWSVDPSTTITQVTLLLALALIFHILATRRWVDRGTMIHDFQVIVAVVSLVLALGIVAHFAGLLPSTHSGRFQGLLNNPNMASQVALLVTFLSFGLFLDKPSAVRLVMIAPAFATLMLSESRTGILALTIGAAWTLARSGVRGIVSTVVILAAVSVYASIFGSGIFSSSLERFGRVDGDGLSGRDLIWDYALQLAVQRPAGWGWGVTEELLKSLYYTTGRGTSTGSVHNSYLQVFLEGGVLAISLLILIYVVILVLLFRVPVAGVAAGLSGAVVAGAVGQFAESSVFGVGQIYPYLYWFAVAGLLAVRANREVPPGQYGGLERGASISHQPVRSARPRR